MHESPELPARDGTTLYVWCDQAGLGPTLDQIAGADSAVRHVVVCGPRPGAGKTGAQAWAELQGGWFQIEAPHITRSAFRGRYGCDGVEVRVTRAEPWFGVDTGPADCAEAMRLVRNVTSKAGVRPFGTPRQTGERWLAAVWESNGQHWPTVTDELSALLRSTSGQGRFQMFTPSEHGGDMLAGVDARFQYGALCRAELPIGEPVEVAGEPDDEYAPSWCEVEFTPAGGPIGLLGVKGIGGWHWPTDGGPHRTWCAGAEIHAARKAGYRVTVRRAIVWPGKARPLASWARQIIGARHRIAGLPLSDGAKSAARGALRSILVQTVGAMHGASPSVFASANMEGGASFSHPEWSTAIYALARVRLAGAMLAQTSPVVACALDGFYVAGEPVVTKDTGDAGVFREEWRTGRWQPLDDLRDLYRLRETGAGDAQAPAPVELASDGHIGASPDGQCVAVSSPETVAAVAVPCAHCGRDSYLGPAHPCCVEWDSRRPGAPCPACSASVEMRRRGGERIAQDRRSIVGTVNR